MKGFSLVELLVVIVIIGFLVIIISSLPNAMNLIRRSGYVGLAREIASKELEEKRAIQYINLALGETGITDPRVNQLPSASGKTLVEQCQKLTQPLFCPNDEPLKFVTVTISWKEFGKDQSFILKTLVSEGGLNQ